jgi:hypothetical protein
VSGNGGYRRVAVHGMQAPQLCHACEQEKGAEKIGKEETL